MNPAVRRPKKHWGADFIGPDEARFRLWAPGEDHVNLVIGGGPPRPMNRLDEGWFELTVSDIAPGAEYAFQHADGVSIPDPASRAQARDVHGPSLLIDPDTYRWQYPQWRGRPWRETVIYELHIGAFTEGGTFRSAIGRLQHLADAGITAVEIMPVAQFSGRHGWGYDGVLPYAPHRPYGSPDDFRSFIDAAHGLGLMVFLDVVYNHFGPEGNYLSRYAPTFFDPQRNTPWGPAIAYEMPPVRRFFIDNALYWLKEFHLDGLRLDAVDHVRDSRSRPEILVEIAKEVRAAITDRHVHLTTEDNRNITYLHERGENGAISLYSGEWNDDFHNVAHVLATGETDGYYSDFADDKWRKLARALADGFVYQGEPSQHGGGDPRGQPSAHLPPDAFIDFLQNHDQIGNRAFGERLLSLAPKDMVKALTAILLLSPHIPLMFMGDEFGETNPFCFFTDFDGDLAEAVRNGRRREFAGFAQFQRPDADIDQIPDPNAARTFESSRLDWTKTETPAGRDWLDFYRKLLSIRREIIVPLLGGEAGNAGRIVAHEDGNIAVDWLLGDAVLQLRANLSDRPIRFAEARGNTLFEYAPSSGTREEDQLAPLSVSFFLAPATASSKEAS